MINQHFFIAITKKNQMKMAMTMTMNISMTKMKMNKTDQPEVRMVWFEQECPRLSLVIVDRVYWPHYLLRLSKNLVFEPCKIF